LRAPKVPQNALAVGFSRFPGERDSGDRFGATASATRKSTQTDVISQSPDKHYISVACAPVVGLPSSFHRLCGSLATRRVENLWPQNSVSKVAVCHVPVLPSTALMQAFDPKNTDGGPV
jgi:hypothetical protein